jgi:flagellar FliL protein
MPEVATNQENGTKNAGTRGWLAIGLFLLFTLALGGGVFFLFLRQDDPLALVQASSDSGEFRPAQSWPLSDFVVNLAPPDENTFLKVDLSLAIRPGEDQEVKLIQRELDARRDELKDLVNMILTSKTRGELATTQGKENLKQELVRRINELLQSGEIQSVYFRQFTFQEL